MKDISKLEIGDWVLFKNGSLKKLVRQNCPDITCCGYYVSEGDIKTYSREIEKYHSNCKEGPNNDVDWVYPFVSKVECLNNTCYSNGVCCSPSREELVEFKLKDKG